MPLAAATLLVPISAAEVTFRTWAVNGKEGIGVGSGEHDLLRPLRRQTHHRNDDVDLVSEQERDPIGARDLLHLDFHAKRLADHLGELDVEADWIAVGVLRAERRRVERHADAHNALRDDVSELVGARFAVPNAVTVIAVTAPKVHLTMIALFFPCSRRCGLASQPGKR